MEHNSIHRRSRTFPVISQFFLGTKDTTNFLFSCRVCAARMYRVLCVFFLKLGSEKCRQQKSKSGERIGLTKRKETAAKAKRQIFRQLQGTNGSTSITYKTHALMSCVFFFLSKEKSLHYLVVFFFRVSFCFVFQSTHSDTHEKRKQLTSQSASRKKNKN